MRSGLLQASAHSQRCFLLDRWWVVALDLNSARPHQARWPESVETKTTPEKTPVEVPTRRPSKNDHRWSLICLRIYFPFLRGSGGFLRRRFMSGDVAGS